LLATLVGAGIAGGIAYNSSQTKVVPAAVKEKIVEKTADKKPAAFSSDAFVTLKVK
jgi:type IV secretory pathway TrbF-like protein